LDQDAVSLVRVPLDVTDDISMIGSAFEVLDGYRKLLRLSQPQREFTVDGPGDASNGDASNRKKSARRKSTRKASILPQAAAFREVEEATLEACALTPYALETTQTMLARIIFFSTDTSDDDPLTCLGRPRRRRQLLMRELKMVDKLMQVRHALPLSYTPPLLHSPLLHSPLVHSPLLHTPPLLHSLPHPPLLPFRPSRSRSVSATPSRTSGLHATPRSSAPTGCS
jgi:hypothetical protein